VKEQEIQAQGELHTFKTLLEEKGIDFLKSFHADVYFYFSNAQLFENLEVTIDWNGKESGTMRITPGDSM
jgi:hypothetical protein